MTIYLTISVIFGLIAAFSQRRKHPRALFVELFITFLVNGALFPLILGFKLAGVLKKDKVVFIPQNYNDKYYE